MICLIIYTEVVLFQYKMYFEYFQDQLSWNKTYGFHIGFPIIMSNY